MSTVSDITKMEASPDSATDRMRLTEVGVPFLKGVGGWVESESRRELSGRKKFQTYDRMRQDSTCNTGLSAAEVSLIKQLANAKFITRSKNQAAKDFCAYLNWNLKNLKDNTWFDSCTNIISYLQYGFSWLEKVYELNTSSSFPQYKYKLKKLAPRSQTSIEKWEFDSANRQVVGLYQYPPYQLNNGILNLNPLYQSTTETKMLPREKFILFSWDSKNNDPTGTSPLNACYKAWKEKILIESYEVTDVAKSLGGLMCLRLPVDHMNKAASDPESDEAKTLKIMMDQAANMSKGDQTFTVLGSDVQGENGNGAYVYDIQILSADSTTKGVTTAELINERKKAILDTFAAGFMNIGNDATGSHSLADSKTSTHAFFMERHILFCASVLQNDLVPQLMKLNGVFLNEADIPTLSLGYSEEVNPEEMSKSVQRVASVGFLPRKKHLILDALTKCGLDTSSLEDLTEEEILESLINPNDTSRGGESMGTSGTGTTQAGGSNSSLNADNGS